MSHIDVKVTCFANDAGEYASMVSWFNEHSDNFSDRTRTDDPVAKTVTLEHEQHVVPWSV